MGLQLAFKLQKGELTHKMPFKESKIETEKCDSELPCSAARESSEQNIQLEESDTELPANASAKATYHYHHRPSDAIRTSRQAIKIQEQ